MSQLDRYLEPPDPWECHHDHEHEDPDECEAYEAEMFEDAQIQREEWRRDVDADLG